MKVLTFAGEDAHLNRFAFQLSQPQKRQCIIVEPLTGLTIAQGKTEKAALQHLSEVSKKIDIDRCIAQWLRAQAQTKRFWNEVNQLYANRS